jgi:predicted transposase YbfD/YdcC
VIFSQHAARSSNAPSGTAWQGQDEKQAAADISELAAVLLSVPEFRQARGRAYKLAFILAACLVAVLGGAKNYREISTTVAAIPQWMLRLMGADWNYFTLRYEYPRRTTIWRALTSVDAAELDAVSGRWLLSQARKGRQGGGAFTWEIAMDGKALRGAWTDENDQFTLFSAMLHREHVTIAQVRVPGDTKESTQVQALADQCDIMEGETVLATLDAAFSGRETGKIIGGKEGWDYLITLKTDKPKLYGKAKEKVAGALGQPPHDVMKETRRGRTKIWSCWTAGANEIEYPHLEQAACILREVFSVTGEKVSKEVAIVITSAKPESMTAANINRHVRNHWGIENRSHYVRDTVYREDHHQAYSGNGPNGLAALRNLAIGLFRLKAVKNIKEATELVHLDLTRAIPLMTT